MVGSWDKYCYNVRINNHKGAWYVCNGDAVFWYRLRRLPHWSVCFIAYFHRVFNFLSCGISQKKSDAGRAGTFGFFCRFGHGFFGFLAKLVIEFVLGKWVL